MRQQSPGLATIQLLAHNLQQRVALSRIYNSTQKKFKTKRRHVSIQTNDLITPDDESHCTSPKNSHFSFSRALAFQFVSAIEFESGNKGEPLQGLFLLLLLDVFFPTAKQICSHSQQGHLFACTTSGSCQGHSMS
uniref:Uncharacterized protein n=1 Tax=Caenorhabditis japonica TaxID=281687 RepID=A0A8R1IJ07_CAEJA